MDDLVQWLGAQLDEDERIAHAAGGRSEQEWRADLSGKDPGGMSSWPVAVRYTTDGRLRGAVANLPVTNERSEDRMVHIAAHDPARVLREIDAKRQLLADLLAEPHVEVDDPFYSCAVVARADVKRYGGPCDCGRDDRQLRRLHILLLPYADRPGYREEWRP
ncbi:DUF6221 family protein [Streptomyces sp. MN6]